MNSLNEGWKKSYATVENTVKVWEKTQLISLPIIESLLNLSEQLLCCEEGAYESELKCDFPDLKKRIRFKIVAVMEEKMKKLREVLAEFKSLKEDLQHARDAMLHGFTQHSGKVDIEMLCRGSPTCPPHVLLLEWLVDLAKWYCSLYEQKKDLVDNIRYNDKVYLQSFLKKWKDESCLYRVKCK